MTTFCRTMAEPIILLTALISVVAVRAEAIAQPCNPAIDGTYCAEQTGKRPSGAATTATQNPSPGDDFFSLVRDNGPATFGAITFSGGTRCVGILRRSSCK